MAISNQSYLQLEETIKYLPGGVENQILTWIDGTYTLYLVDQAGNSTTYTFTIDTVPPEGSLSGYYQLIDDIYYGNNSSIINFVFDSTEAKAKFNNQEYTGGSIRIVGSELNDGLYNIELIDKAGKTTR